MRKIKPSDRGSKYLNPIKRDKKAKTIRKQHVRKLRKSA